MENNELVTIGEDFRAFLRTKLQDKSDEAVEEAVELYGEGILGFHAIMSAQDGSINVVDVKNRFKEQKKTRKEREKEAKARYEQEQKYNASLTWLYEINYHEFNYSVDIAPE